MDADRAVHQPPAMNAPDNLPAAQNRPIDRKSVV
jgi:hypothetical protein